MASERINDFLRDKRVAVDIPYWVVQHETALKKKTGGHGYQPRNPHLRLTFFRTLSLFSKFGAFPVFVADDTPSPLKSKARILRFFKLLGSIGRVRLCPRRVSLWRGI